MRRCSVWGALLILGGLGACGLFAQTQTERRVTARMQALQREADQLAAQARTLLGELRSLDVERQIRREQLRQVDADLAAAAAALERTSGRIAALEARRVAQQPGLEARLVAIYKRGRPGYARLLFGAEDLRELGRATRTVAALARIDRQRIEEHRRTVAALQIERDELDRRNQHLTALRLEGRRAQAALEASIAARTALIARIDQRRDLTARMAGELEVARQRLRQAVTTASTGSGGTIAVPLAPFRGDLEWPVDGRIVARFGRPGRFGSLAAPGVEIAVAEETSVHAVHPGTVTFADTLAGFGNVVVVDHGDNAATVYGYLSRLDVARGDRVEAGEPVGASGSTPAGGGALYFEVRIDGAPADPVQWLKPR